MLTQSQLVYCEEAQCESAQIRGVLSSPRQNSPESTYYAGTVVADMVDHVYRYPSNVTNYDLVSLENVKKAVNIG